MATARQSGINIQMIENEVGCDQSGDLFLVGTPQSYCCNCGTRNGLSAIPTSYIQASVFSTNFDNRLSFELKLPYCSGCAKRVGSRPVWGSLKIVVGFVLWMALWAGFVILLPVSAPKWLHLSGLIVPIFLVLLLFKLLDRPRAPMTAKYFPVHIKEFSGHQNATRYEGIYALVLSGIAYFVGFIARTVSGKNPHAIDKLTFTFSNPTYAKEFAKANDGRWRQGTIRIKNLPFTPKGSVDGGAQESAANDAGRSAAIGAINASKPPARKAPPKVPNVPLTFALFSAWFVTNAQAYCDWHDNENSGDDLTLSTQIRRLKLRPASPGENKPAGSFELSLAIATTLKYHDAPVTPGLNEKVMESLALINLMRGNAGGTQNMNWWLWFAPDPQGGTAGWRFVDGEVLEEGTEEREPIDDTEWIMKSMAQLDLPHGSHREWQVQQVGSTAIVSAKNVD